MKTFSIDFGALSPKIEKQLKDQGLKTGRTPLIQACADAVVLLAIHGIISDGEKDKARRRIMNFLKDSVKTSFREGK